MIFGIGLLVGCLLGTVFYYIATPPCRRKGCDSEQIVDCENRRTYQKCKVCGKETQYDFQAYLNGTDWVGFCSGENKCSLCMGWKPRAWKFCSSSYCELNPKGPMRLV